MIPALSQCVATLVSAPSVLGADLVRDVAAVLPGAGPPRRLGPAAADIPFAPLDSVDNRRRCEAARSVLAGAPVDVVVQPAAGRRKRLLVADMDATLITEECIDEMAAAVGRGVEVAAITARSTRGDVDFAASLVERVALLRGLEVATIAAIAARATPMPGARVLAATMRAHGAFTVIASGGFTLVSGPVAARLGFDRHYANTLDVADGRLTGTVRAPLFSPESKRDTLLALRDELGLAAADTLAVGDGANDIPMLREAGLGVAFRAKPVVAAAVSQRVDHADLTALLHIQGYTSDEFVEAGTGLAAPSAMMP